MNIYRKRISKGFNYTLTLFIILMFLSSTSESGSFVKCNSSERDYWPTDAWQYMSLEEANMSEIILDDMFEYAEQQNYNLQGVLVVKDGYLVVEEYPDNRFNATDIRYIFSCTKSFTSTLIGIAIEEGYIESVDQKILDFFPNMTLPNIELKENVTLHHLLTMTSGIDWVEGEMSSSPDWVEYCLSREMASEPGITYYYSTASSHLLSAILVNATGNSTLDYATKHIFDPLGFSPVIWDQDPQGIYQGGSGLRLLPRDMAKFGYLFLNKGTWNGTQIVSEEWVQQATNATITESWGSYGYQWCVFPDVNIYWANGLLSQQIIIIPDYDMVVVFTAYYDYQTWHPFIDILVQDYILRAVNEGYGYQTPTPTPSTETSIELITIPVFLAVALLLLNRKKIRK